MPKFLKRLNRAGVPIAALILTSLLIQIFLVVTLTSEDALNFMLDLCTSLSLVPYFLVAAYGFKLAITKETYESEAKARRSHTIIAGLATIYTVFLVYAAGLKFLLLSCVIYAPGTALYVKARRENNKPLFRRAEAVLCGTLIVGGVAGVIGLASGAITI
jgi:arginine:ornithine antiporter/lysine permease